MNFNEKQLNAIKSDAPKLVVIAPPGSGKTATLVGAIREHRLNNPLEKICGITFTKKATAELMVKLHGVPNIEVSTIHSWSLKELRKLSNQKEFEVSILSEPEVEEILEAVIKKRGYTRIFMPALISFVGGNTSVNVSDNEKKRYRAILDDYTIYKRANKLYDFHDLPLYLFDMLNMYDSTITTVDALFVDEFQDVDDIQAQIFTMVMAKKHFYIGDPDQSIYMFRGAEEGVLDSLEGFERYELDINYRSYQNIVNYATSIRDCANFNDATTGVESWIKCSRDLETGEVIRVYGNTCRLLRADLAVWEVQNMPLEETILNFLNKKPQILCRSNKQVKEIEKLGYKSVSTIHAAKGLEYTDVVVISFELEGLEELNIGYVAATRARDSLMVSDFETFLRIVSKLVATKQIDFAEKSLF